MNSLNILPTFVDANGVVYYQKSQVEREILQREKITAHFPTSAYRRATPEEIPNLETLGMQASHYRGRKAISLLRADAVQEALKTVAPSLHGMKKTLSTVAETTSVVEESTAYVPINSQSAILRASWHQGNVKIFGHAGVQCCAMAIANIIRSSILSPEKWDVKILNANMIAADKLYGNILSLSRAHAYDAHPIGQNGFLSVINFDVVKEHIQMFKSQFSLEYDADDFLVGSLEDNINDGVIGQNFDDALQSFFQQYNAGIVIARGKTFGIMNYGEKYYFTDSHSCTSDGAPEATEKGKACVVQCRTLNELVRTCRRTMGWKNDLFNIYYIKVDRL